MIDQLIIEPAGNYLTQAKPRIIPLYTDRTYAAITTAGYLNQITAGTSNKVEAGDVISALYDTGLNAWFKVAIAADGVITMSPISNPGEVSLVGAAVAGNLPKFNSTNGDIEDSLIPAANTLQTTTDVTDYQIFVPITDIIINSVGTWTRTRVATGNYSLVHTPADDTSVIGIDITAALRAATGRGFKLASFDTVYTIATLALDAHTIVLNSVAYANNVAVAVTSVPLTESLATATQANPYVTNLAVTTPAFLNTAAAKYNVELTVNAAATSVYSFYGLNLHFTKSVA